jgi:flagellar biosynthesis component FlhA
VRGLSAALLTPVKYFLKDASIVIMSLAVLFFIMAAVGSAPPVIALLLGASVGLTAAAARAWRRTQEDRAAASRKPGQRR